MLAIICQHVTGKIDSSDWTKISDVVYVGYFELSYLACNMHLELVSVDFFISWKSQVSKCFKCQQMFSRTHIHVLLKKKNNNIMLHDDLYICCFFMMKIAMCVVRTSVQLENPYLMYDIQIKANMDFVSRHCSVILKNPVEKYIDKHVISLTL